MLGEIVGDIVRFFFGLVGAGSAAANITGATVVGSLDNVFDFLPEGPVGPLA
ncbi:hypothetical protein ACWIE7_16375 [Dietzia sp. NPDC055343]